jgi:hypothetical protein
MAKTSQMKELLDFLSRLTSTRIQFPASSTAREAFPSLVTKSPFELPIPTRRKSRGLPEFHIFPRGNSRSWKVTGRTMARVVIGFAIEVDG